MDQALALEVLMAGNSAFLTGPAGSGKTYVLNQFIREAKQSGQYVAVTATTGLAATHIGGSTIHAWSGIGVSDRLSDDFEDYMLKSRREIIEKTDILVIDEVSMLHDYRLDMVNAVCKAVRDDDSPFGGIQVVLCGDFFQLPPINRAGDETQGGFVTRSESWQELDPVICYLAEQHRQDDDEFLDILSALRGGDIRRHHAEKLIASVNPEHAGEATELHTVNVDVDRINKTRLSEIVGDSHSYSMHTTGSENYVASLKRSCLALEDLTLKQGALVMAIKNSPDKAYVNGSLGEVISFESMTNYPVVKLMSGRTVTFKPESWELRDGEKKRAGLSQIPLRLAWAITVHKSQGMTLDAAVIDLRKAFVEGMGYVALSRVKSLDGLTLIGINKMALRVSQEAQDIDETLRKKAADHHARLEHLRENGEKRRKQSAKKGADKESKSKSWAERIEKMREKHPNAYRPWTNEQDERLKQDFTNGVNTKELSKKLGRHERSVLLRLQKHYGEDVVAT